MDGFILLCMLGYLVGKLVLESPAFRWFLLLVALAITWAVMY